MSHEPVITVTECHLIVAIGQEIPYVKDHAADAKDQGSAGQRSGRWEERLASLCPLEALPPARTRQVLGRGGRQRSSGLESQNSLRLFRDVSVGRVAQSPTLWNAAPSVLPLALGPSSDCSTAGSTYHACSLVKLQHPCLAASAQAASLFRKACSLSAMSPNSNVERHCEL